QALADLADVVDGRPLARGGRGPHVANGLEKPSRHADLVLPWRAEIDVTEQGSLHVAAEEGLPAIAVETSLHVRHEPGHEPIPLLHGPDFLLDLGLGAFLPEERRLLPDRDPAHQGPADAAPERLDLHLVSRGRHTVADELLEMQILVELQALAGEDEQRGFANVENGVADPFQELGDEEMGDDEAGILSRSREASEGLRESLAVLPIELGLAPTRMLGLLCGRVGESRDDLLH